MKEAKNGTYHQIGQGLLRNPDLFETSTAEMVELVAAGKNVYISVE